MSVKFSDSDRERLRMLTEMVGITREQQEHLWHLATNVGPDEVEAYAKKLEAQGGTFKYSKEEVDQALGKRKPLWRQLLGF